MAELATEPAWLEERRKRGASLVETLLLPTAKSKGWEFTDLGSLDLDSYTGADATVEVSGGEGATVVSLAEAVESHSELLERALGYTRVQLTGVHDHLLDRPTPCVGCCGTRASSAPPRPT